MSIKLTGGIFGRNPTFNDMTVEGDLSLGGSVSLLADSISGDAINGGTATPENLYASGDLSVASSVLYVDSTLGRSGIGTASPQKKVDIRGNSGASTDNVTLRITCGDTSAILNQVTSRIENYTSDADGPHVASYIETISNDSYGRQSSLSFGVSQSNNADATEAFRIDNTGDVTVSSGNLVIGTSGNGIDFSATSGTGTSELFDDYEEGTWTPEVADAQTGGNTASGTFTGYYTKIGRMVNLMFLLDNIDTTGMSSSAVLYFRNFPFASVALSGAQRALSSVHFASGVTFDTSAIYTGEMPDNFTWGRIAECSSGSGRDFLRVSDITSGSNQINLQFNYYT